MMPPSLKENTGTMGTGSDMSSSTNSTPRGVTELGHQASIRGHKVTPRSRSSTPTLDLDWMKDLDKYKVIASE